MEYQENHHLTHRNNCSSLSWDKAGKVLGLKLRMEFGNEFIVRLLFVPYLD